MDTIDHDVSVYTTNKGDENLLVKFYMDTVQDIPATKEAGRPIFKEVEFVDIRIPGNKDNVVIRPAHQRDKARFPRHYQLFKSRIEGAKEEMVGTPLALWPEVSAAQLKEFEFFNIRTVEQLANMPDSTAQKFGGIQALKQKASAYMEAATKKAPIAKLRAEVETLQEQVRQLMAVNEALKKKVPKDE